VATPHHSYESNRNCSELSGSIAASGTIDRVITDATIRDALRHVIDPELGINIVDLGLVYGVEVDDAHVRIEMTMTSPACPLGDYLMELVESAITERVPDVKRVDIAFVWEPPWGPEMMSADGRRQLDGDRS
jgi:metal-sulfur cluster biosynthetic enzyme